MTTQAIEDAYIELWHHVENGISTDKFFELRATFRQLVQSQPLKPKIEKVCGDCGSTEISIEGSIEWDSDNQEYLVDSYCEGKGWCNQCGQIRVEDKQIIMGT